MKNLQLTIAGALITLSLASCSATNQLNRRLQGSWNIRSYEEQHVGEKEVAAANIGTMTFNDDDSGTKKITYRILNNQITDNSRFSWNNTAKTVTIEGEKSPFAKTWIIIKNKTII